MRKKGPEEYFVQLYCSFNVEAPHRVLSFVIFWAAILCPAEIIFPKTQKEQNI